MTDYIIDTNIVAKWLLPEPNSNLARGLLSPGYKLRAPDLLLPELANVFWKGVGRGDFTIRDARELLKRFVNDHVDVTVRLLPSSLIIKQALEIAAAERHSIYDCIYLGLAVQARCPLITADTRFVKTIRSRILKDHIIPLSDLSLY